MSTEMIEQRRTPPGGGRRSRWPRVLAYVAGGLVTVVAVGWAGLQVEPEPLAEPDLQPGDVTRVPLPAGLPAPVERFYRTLYGEEVPLITSAVISGRGEMRISGITFPVRYRFSHVTGEAYRHYIELTGFGARITAVNEWYLDGRGRLDLPFGVSDGPNIDQGANLALWAEAVWMPSVWVTDPAARWEPIDDTTALLVVPFGVETEEFTVTFDPQSGLLERMESMRFKTVSDEARILWINQAAEWGEVNNHPVPLRTSITWGDEDSPWARLDTENVLYNADLGTYIEAAGP